MNGDRPLYYVEPRKDDPGVWDVIGPNGVVDTYRDERDAQSQADRLNEDVAQEQEDDS